MLLFVAAIVCGAPRGYEGPREAPSVESQVEPQAQRERAPAVEPPRELVYAPLEPDRATPDDVRAADPPRPFASQPRMPGSGPFEPPVRLRTGRGLLIAGGVLAGGGLTLSIVSIAGFFRPCFDFCEPYGAIFSSIAAPVPWLVGIGMLGGGMQHRSNMIAWRDLAERRAMKPPRRGLFGGGLAMTIIGTGAIVGTWWAPGINAFAQLGGGSLAVAGAMMTGAARGRRLALRKHIAVAPFVTRTTAMLSVRMRW